MERPSAYTHQIFAQGLAYVYGVSIRLQCDKIPEPLELYLDPGKPLSVITLTFRAGGLYYSTTRLIRKAGAVIAQNRKRDNTNNTQMKESRQGAKKQYERDQ